MNDPKQNVSSSQKLVGNTLLSSMSEMSLIFNSVFFILAARFLGDTILGMFNTAIEFVGLFVFFVFFGFNYSITKVVVRDREKMPVYVVNALFIQLLVGFLVFGICLLTAYFLRSKYPLQVRYVIMIVFGAETFRAFNFTLRTSFKALGKFTYDVIAVVSERSFLMLVGGFLLIQGAGLFVVASVLLVGRIISFSILVSFLVRSDKWKSPKLDIKTCTMLVKESVIFIAQVSITKIYEHIDVVMISLMRKFEEVGWYSLARRILNASWFVPDIITSAVYPELSSRHLVSKKLVCKLFDRSFKYILVIAIIITLGVLMLAKVVIIGLVGEEYANSVAILTLLGIAIIPSYLRFLFGTTLIAINKQKKVVIVNIGRNISNIVLNFILIILYGYMGAAIATVGTEYLSLVIFILFLKQENIIYKEQLKFIYKPILAVAGVVPLYFVFNDLLDILKAVIMIAVYGMLILLLRVFDQDEIRVFKKFLFHKILKVRQ
ncbi:MAG: flippase [bacterium]